jgi:hypothetical protein
MGRVRLLVSLEVEGVPGRDLGSRKARTLLKVQALADHQRFQSIASPASCGATNNPPARPEQVGVLVSRLRGVLGTERIRRADTGYIVQSTGWTSASSAP